MHRFPMLAPVITALLWLGMAVPASASLIGELSGTVTGGGAPLPSVWVTLVPVTDQGNPSGRPKRTLTDELGRYEFPEVYDRAVKVHVRAPLFGQLVDTYWPDVHSFAQAGIVEISSWPVTADVDLPVGVTASGRVVDAETGAPVTDARVSAVIAAAPFSGAVGVSDLVEGPGAFSLSGLPPVPMQLRVRLPAGTPYLAVGPGSSTAGVRIDGSASPSTSGVTIALPRGAEIRGTVRDDTGAPVAGALVKLVGCLPNCPLIATSDDSGAYRMIGVSPGTRLGVVAWKGDRLLRQWYPGRADASQATDIAVEPGDVLDGIDFALVRGAFVTVGVFAAESGAPLPGTIVQLISSSDPFERHIASRSPDEPGRMRVGPVPPGSYIVSVTPGAANPDYLPVTRLLDRAVAPRGIIELAPEEDLTLVAELPPSMGTRPIGETVQGPGGPGAGGEGEGAGHESEGSGSSGSSGTAGASPWPSERNAPAEAWPGLAQGFLTTVA